MKSVLSTRHLNREQKALAARSGIHIESYDAIQIDFLKNEIPSGYSHYIFTSKNGVKGYLNNLNADGADYRSITCYCVGEKTKSYLTQKGLFVVNTAKNSAELGDFLVKSGEKGPFLVFTGNRNRPDLGRQLEEHEIPFREIRVYETQIDPKKFDKDFAGILFYSPSGVQSFILANEPKDAIAICIGETTAKEARRHFHSVLVANTPTTDNVIETLIENYPTLANS